MVFSRPYTLLPTLLVLWSMLTASKAQKDHPDRMKWLPGYPHPLPTPWFSGYVDYVLEGMHIHTHYVLVQAEVSTKDTPLIYWSNGGPGASSLFGLLTELGPLLLSDLSLHTPDYDETGIPTPIYNPYAWSKLGSILVFDAPAPVGFSYCNDDLEGKGESCLSWTDELASENSFHALHAFYDKFPEFKPKPLYLTGESYAGIYIPTLARRILEDPDNDLKLMGFAVGDGCLGTHTEVCGDLGLGNASWKTYYFGLLFLAGHAQMPLASFHNLLQVCSAEQQALAEKNDVSDISPECQTAIHSILKEVGGFYEYSLYDDCTYRNGLLLQNNVDGVLFHSDTMLRGGALNDYTCGGGPVMEDYMRMTSVLEAFHIPPGGAFFSVDNAVDFDYTPTEPDLTGFYMDLASGKYGDIRVLIYNGDTDPAITSFAAQDWTSNLGLSEVESWRPWTIDSCRRMGGYVTRYEGSFDFLTIRGAGHLVPTYKPEASFAFLKAWIENDDYPRFVKDCVSPPEVDIKDSHVIQRTQ